MTFQEWLKDWLGVNEGGIGPQGPPGPAGPPGPQGPAGPIDPSLTARVALLEARVDALTAPIIVSPQPEPTTLLGVGSASTSLTEYPKTGPVTSGDWYVDPNAATNGDGTQESPFDNLEDALEAVRDGQRVIVRAGTLTLERGLNRSATWANGIEVFAYGTERPVIDMSGIGTSRALSMRGAREHWKGFEFVDGAGGVIIVTGSHYTVEDCWAHRVGTTGVGGGMFYVFGHTNTGTVFQDCAIWRVGDGRSTSTNTPDCFKIHASYGTPDQVASGHAIVRCFAANGPDDNYDLFYGKHNRVLDSVAYRAGKHYTGYNGADGTGFKMGSGNTNVGGNTARGCIAIGNKNVGINSNFATSLPTNVINCTVVLDDFRSIRAPAAGSDVRNNLVHSNGREPDAVTGSHNSWNAPEDAGGNANFPIGSPSFADAGAFDWSLAGSSVAIGAADDGGNLGASTVALEIAREWLGKDLGA